MISFIDANQLAANSRRGSQQEDGREAEYLEVVEELEQQNKRILELMTQIREVDTSLQTSNGYIKKTLFNKDPASARDDSGGDMLMR